MTARYPLREPLWVRLLTALDRCGRRAEALEQYDQIRARIADEFGVDPGAELRQLHADLLADQPALTTSARLVAAVGRPDPAAIPRQLPADVVTFVGRAAELAELESTDSASTVAVAAIDGMAGVGKTALAVHEGGETPLLGRFILEATWPNMREHAADPLDYWGFRTPPQPVRPS